MCKLFVKYQNLKYKVSILVLYYSNLYQDYFKKVILNLIVSNHIQILNRSTKNSKLETKLAN